MMVNGQHFILHVNRETLKSLIYFYLSKIYEEIKQRPRYIVAERVGLDKGTGKDEVRGG